MIARTVKHGRPWGEKAKSLNERVSGRSLHFVVAILMFNVHLYTVRCKYQMSRTSIPVRDKFNVKQCQSPHQMSKEGGKQATSRPQRYVVVKSTAQIRRTSEDVVPLYLSTQAQASALQQPSSEPVAESKVSCAHWEVKRCRATRQTDRQLGVNEVCRTAQPQRNERPRATETALYKHASV